MENDYKKYELKNKENNNYPKLLKTKLLEDSNIETINKIENNNSNKEVDFIDGKLLNKEDVFVPKEVSKKFDNYKKVEVNNLDKIDMKYKKLAESKIFQKEEIFTDLNSEDNFNKYQIENDIFKDTNNKNLKSLKNLDSNVSLYQE